MNAQKEYQPQYPAQYPPPQNVASEAGWFQRNQKNKPQSNSVGAASLIFISGGMSIASSFSVSNFSTFDMTKFLRVSWFLAAIFGALIGAIFANRVKNKILLILASVLVIIGGILLVSLPNNFGANMAARFFDGLASGLLIAPILIMGGEEAIKEMRGMLTSSVEAMSFTIGIFIQTIFDTVWTLELNRDFHAVQMHGILSIFYAAIALLIAFLLVVESPIYFLLRNEEQTAIDCLRRLQRPFVITNETYAQLEDHKRYVSANKEMTGAESAVAGLPALLKLCYYRSMVALSYSVMFNLTVFLSALFSSGSYKWALITIGTIRFLGAIISIFFLDSVGRKVPMLFGVLICGGMAIGVGSIYGDLFNILSSSKMTTVIVLLIIYELFAGFSITSSSVYLSEGFPMAVKPYYIAISFIFEMLVQIIILVCDIPLDGISDYFYAVGALSFVFFFFAILCLPETKKTSLYEAQCKHRAFLNIGFK